MVLPLPLSLCITLTLLDRTTSVPLQWAALSISMALVIAACGARLFTHESVTALFCLPTTLALASCAMCFAAPCMLPATVAIAIVALLITSNHALLVAIPPPAVLLRSSSLPAAMAGRVVVITGSSAGIGLEAATQLLTIGATVVFACRSAQRAKAAMETALRVSSAPPQRAVFMSLDVANLVSVREFALAFAQRFTACDALICNAGCMLPTRQLSPQGHEANLATNHLGHFLLVQLLLPLLRQSAGRVVFVASSLHKGYSAADSHALAAALLNDPHSRSDYALFRAYAKSKLAMVAGAIELHRRESKHGVLALSLHPGTAYTEIARGMPLAVQWAQHVLQPLLRLWFQSASEAAYTITFAAASPEACALAGAYLERCKAQPAAKAARNPAFTARIWDLSESMVAPFTKSLRSTDAINLHG